MMDTNAKIYIAGHRGMVGSALVRALTHEGYTRLLLQSREELDLVNQGAVEQFFEREKPEYVLLAAAKVGGILTNNTYRADFIYQNLIIASNVIHQSYRHGVKRLLFMGSSCVYPKLCPQPIQESYLLTGPLEPTNEPYAIAKVAGIKLCESYRRQHGCDFFSVMPTNLYGPDDNYDLNNSHVLPALLRKTHEAKQRGESEVAIWGDGTPRREFLYVDDLADACVFLMNQPHNDDWVNIGTGKDITIRELAGLVAEAVGFRGALRFEENKPNGTPRKLLDVSKLRALGWRHRVEIEEGIRRTYQERFGSHGTSSL